MKRGVNGHTKIREIVEKCQKIISLFFQYVKVCQSQMYMGQSGNVRLRKINLESERKTSSSLHWLNLRFFMPFCTVEHISDQPKFLPPIQFSTFWVPKLFYYILKHNVPSYLTLTLTTRVLLFYLPLKNITVFTQ